MNNDQIDNLIRTISRLQIELNQTQQQLDHVRRQVNNNNINQNEPRPPEPPQPPIGEEREGFRVGDTVRILNKVRLSGSIRSSRNVEGVVSRFTGNYVIVCVPLTPIREGVGRFQNVRRAFHNIERLSRVGE